MKRGEFLRIAGATLVVGTAAGIFCAAAQIAQNRYLQERMLRIAALTLEERVHGAIIIGAAVVLAAILLRFVFRRMVRPFVARVVEVRLRNPNAVRGAAACGVFFISDFCDYPLAGRLRFRFCCCCASG